MRKGELSFLGMGTTMIQGIKIGKNVTIGAGSVVIKNVPDKCSCFRKSSENYKK